MSLNKKTVDDINVKGKRVLVRCDFNVPLKDGKITDETRINAALPTIQKLINDGGKVILCSHLGKVKNGPNEGESLAPVAKSLSEKLGKEVVFVSDYNVTGEAATKAVNAMKEGDVVLLQNTRFRGAEETKNGEQFSKELADLADDYVCDAFGSSHRAHASVAGVTKFISAKGGSNVVGYLMEKEIAFLGNAVENPVRPFVAILGGAKVADKLNVISNLLEKCDTLIIGGGMAFTFLKAQGKEIGKSLVDDTKLEYCKEILPAFDKDVVKQLRTALKRRGVEIQTEAEVCAIRPVEGVMKQVEYRRKGKTAVVEAEYVLMAVGRSPVVPQGLAEAGAVVGRRGIEVDPRFETAVPGVYAVGDCNGISLLAHAASAQARVVMGEDIDLSVVPAAVFTVPECAMAGMTEEQCRRDGVPCQVSKCTFRSNGKALAMGEPEGVVKTLTDPSTGILIGCQIVGPHAADMIAEAALAISARMPASAIARTIHSHPTLGEVLQSACS